MTHWNTKDVCALIANENYKTTVSPPGGDVDTENIFVAVKECNDCLYIRGFNTDDYETGNNGSDCDIEYVELTDGLDSRGGLNSREHNLIVAYADILEKLSNGGFVVVQSLNSYF